jgi:hypothetical protein
MSAGGWIGVALDGTLARYDGWKGIEHIGEPIPLMLERVKRWVAEGVTVKIFTARAWVMHGNAEQQLEGQNVIKAIDAWCLKHIGQTLPVTCVKDFQMVELWDDRAVQVEVNTGRRMDGRPEGAPTP